MAVTSDTLIPRTKSTTMPSTQHVQHHILLIGGTGTCGLIFIRAALSSGHSLTLYLRTPSKLPSDISSHRSVVVTQGELGDEEGLKKAAACGADTFISLAGPTMGERKGTPITNALKILYPLLLKSGTFTRVLILSTASYTAPQDTRSLKWFVSVNLYVKVIGGDAYKEISGMAKETVALGDRIEWTVFRVPLLQGKDVLIDDDPGKVNAVWVGDNERRDRLHLDRGRLAMWILEELKERKWIRSCPFLANAHK